MNTWEMFNKNGECNCSGKRRREEKRRTEKRIRARSSPSFDGRVIRQVRRRQPRRFSKAPGPFCRHHRPDELHQASGGVAECVGAEERDGERSLSRRQRRKPEFRSLSPARLSS